MREELTYAAITPYSLLKSRTGGIIGRLLTLANVDLVAVRVYVPSDEFVRQYADSLRRADIEPPIKEALVNYVNDNFSRSNRFGISNRVVVLLFKGYNALVTLKRDAIGPISPTPKGDTIRGTYGDVVTSDGKITYFEPAVLTARDPQMNRQQLEILARFAMPDGGVHENVIPYPEGTQVETTCVILKPDNFARKSVRPGNIIDIFSKTGLYVIAARLLRLSVAQAEELYAPLKDSFPDKLKGQLAGEIRKSLRSSIPFEMSDKKLEKIAELLKHDNATYEFNRIVEYMSGTSPANCTPEERDKPGKEQCLALLYQGENAVTKIRDRLGSTDPNKAAAGTVRSDLGRDLMKNAAHASDSVESAQRERQIIGFAAADTCDVKEIVEEYLAQEES